MIKPMPRDSQAFAQVANLCEKRNEKALTQGLIEAGKLGAKPQLRMALTIQQVADDAAGQNAIPSLGDTIVIQQSHAIDTYGERTRPMTEKQIAIIVRDVLACFPIVLRD